MTNVYWKKIDVWCKYPFNQEIERREIEFYSRKKCDYKSKHKITCDSQIVGKDRVNLVAKYLGQSSKRIKLIKL